MKAHYPNFRETLVVFLFLAFGFTRGQAPNICSSTNSIIFTSTNGDTSLPTTPITKDHLLITEYESPFQNFFNITNANSKISGPNVNGETYRDCYTDATGSYGIGATVINVDNVNVDGMPNFTDANSTTYKNYFSIGMAIETNSPSLFVNRVKFTPHTTYIYKSSTSNFNRKVYIPTNYRIGIVNKTDSPSTITWVTSYNNSNGGNAPGDCASGETTWVFDTGTYGTVGYEMQPGKNYEVRFYLSRRGTSISLPRYNGTSTVTIADNATGETTLSGYTPSSYAYISPDQTKFTTTRRRTDNVFVYGYVGAPKIPDLEVNCGVTTATMSSIMASLTDPLVPSTVTNLNAGGGSTSTVDSKVAFRIYNSSGVDVTNNTTLPIGTYYAAYMLNSGTTASPNYNCRVSNQKTFTITQKSTNWDGSTWSNGIPTLNSLVTINGNYDTAVNGNLDACNLTVNNGYKLDIKGNTQVRVSNNIINNNLSSTNDYNFIVQNDGNLIQINDNGTFTGNLTLYRNSAPVIKGHYVYWGSPVNGQNLLQFSPNTLSSRFYTYNESNDLFVWIDPSLNSFSRANGYAIRAPNNWYTSVRTPYTGKFQGNPYTGAFTFPIVKSANVIANNGASVEMGNTLISNPYPSNIDLDTFFTINSGKIYSTAYFWTNTYYNPPMQGVNYPSNLPAKPVINNYAIYNKSGGTPAPFGWSGGTGTTTTVTLPITPNNIVKPGQGFIVKVSGTAPINNTISFNNSTRVTEQTNTQFYSRVNSKNNTETIDRYWLTLKTPLDFVTPILIAYKEDASNVYEFDYDSEPLIDSGDNFYSIIPDHHLTIQGRKGPLDINDRVSLGMGIGLEGNHTISLSGKEGKFEQGQPIYLYDKYLNKEINLQEESYNFASATGIYDDRFELSYIPNTTLGNGNVKNQEDILIYKNDQSFYIKSNKKINEILVYDNSGKLIKKIEGKSTVVNIKFSELKTGVYILDINSEGNSVKKKIINP